MDWLTFWTIYAQVLIATTLLLPISLAVWFLSSAVSHGSAAGRSISRTTKIQ